MRVLLSLSFTNFANVLISWVKIVSCFNVNLWVINEDKHVKTNYIFSFDGLSSFFPL